MGYNIYSCSDGFPAKIPTILSELAPPVTCRAKDAAVESELDSFYHYEVERGLGRIWIYGGREDGIMSVVIVGGVSLNPLRWPASSKLENEVRCALLKAGIKEFAIEDPEEFEARRIQNEGKQTAAGDGGNPAN